MINDALYKNQKKKSRGVKCREQGGQRMGSSSSYLMIRELLDQKGMNTIGEMRWCTI
jgi:hypothetical protein